MTGFDCWDYDASPHTEQQVLLQVSEKATVVVPINLPPIFVIMENDDDSI